MRKPIDSGAGWISCEKLVALRLLGKQPLDALFDREAALVFLASHAIRPVFKSAFRELRCEIHYDRVKFHEGQLSRPEVRAITPADAAAARAVLLEIIDQAIERLGRLDAEHAEADEILEMVESNIVSEAEAKQVAQIQRHGESANRLVIRNLDTIKRWHRWKEEGWGKARRERLRLKEAARRGIMVDERFVVDERGDVRDAQGYEGDVEAGLARYKAEHGAQPCESPSWRAAVDGGARYRCGTSSVVDGKAEYWQRQGQTEAITDRACEMAAGNGGAQEAPGTSRADSVTDDRAVNQVAVAGVEVRDGATDLGQVGLSGFVPLTLAGQGPATNVQNEIVVAEPSEGLGEGVIEDLDAGEQGGGETECEEDVSGDRPRASLPEPGCVVLPRAREPVSKRERRRRGRERARRREMAKQEFERRRGVIASQPDVSVGEILDSVQGLLPNAVAFLRKHGPRSP